MLDSQPLINKKRNEKCIINLPGVFLVSSLLKEDETNNYNLGLFYIILHKSLSKKMSLKMIFVLKKNSNRTKYKIFSVLSKVIIKKKFLTLERIFFLKIVCIKKIYPKYPKLLTKL